ncbi:MAG TPA: sporulation transcription factor Spo0A [Firmicutes bacterium]|nr:sporulation transcription factor Spo0A [Bacillota bacterium]
MMLKILIADNNVGLCETLNAFLERQEGMEVVGIAHDGEETLQLIEDLEPDVVLLDITMPLLDGLGVMERLVQLNLFKRPKVIVLTAFGREDVIRRFTDLGADYFVVKPFDLNVLAERIRQFAGEDGDESVVKEADGELSSQSSRMAVRPAISREAQVTELLHRIGIPAHFKGYNYLRDAVMVVIEEEGLFGGSLTKELYPRLAQKYNTTPGGVEAAIRNAVITAWEHGNRAYLEELTGRTNKGRFPTNSLIIAKLADQIKYKSRLDSVKLL